MDQEQKFKIRLASGRVLGPLSVELVRQLILKNQILGKETAREHPQGEWKDINEIPALAELLMANLEGRLKEPSEQKSSFGIADPLKSSLAPSVSPVVRTEVLAIAETEEPGTSAPQVEEEGEQPVAQHHEAEDDGATVVGITTGSSGGTTEEVGSTEEKTMVGEHKAVEIETVPSGSITLESADTDSKFSGGPISEEKTVLFTRSPKSASTRQSGRAGQADKKRQSSRYRNLIVGIAMVLVFYELFFDDDEVKPVIMAVSTVIHPELPEYKKGKTDVQKSSELYNQAIVPYLKDNVGGYKEAAEKFKLAAEDDIGNVKALAMLASSYINLIDNSNKDDNYFAVLTKLIDMSRAKSVDLPETVIADVEFYVTVNKAEAAQNRVIDYTKTHPKFGLEMFYYLALSFLARGDATSAARFAGQIPDNKVFSSKVFYLRGQIAEKLQDVESAMREYKKAIQMNQDHAKSHLRIANLLVKKGLLKEAGPDLEFVVSHSNLVSPKEYANALYLHAQLAELYKKWDVAVSELERAVDLDRESHDYLLELYTIKAKTDTSLKVIQKNARMYYFLSEGERLIREGQYQDALTPLLRARQENDRSPLPLMKIGDMFSYLHDIENTKMNYKMAAERAPNDINVWTKYIKSLIESYEWTEAAEAMDKFRKLPVSQSAIDKAAADMYQKQGMFKEAQTFYRKAMNRESIDSSVYIAYAKSLMSTNNFKDAPFFFALGLRYDPLNVDAVINTAKCVAETESVDRAISLLQDELKQGDTTRPEYLVAIAELQVKKGDWQQAVQNVNQAIKLNPNYAVSFKVLAEIYMNNASTDKHALDQALGAYKSFSDRNPSDPSGYLERYKIFVKQAKFEQAKDELNKIYEIYPKYPHVHFYLGILYAVQGNHKAAAQELSLELKNNPNDVQTLVAYGKELLELGDAQVALGSLTQAMTVAPTNVEAKQQAAWANFKLKHYQAAVALMNSAIALDKANPILYQRMGMIFKGLGDTGSACVAFRKYLEMEPDATDKDDFRECLK